MGLDALAENLPGKIIQEMVRCGRSKPIITWLIIFVSEEDSAYGEYFCKPHDDTGSFLYLESGDLDPNFGQQHSLSDFRRALLPPLWTCNDHEHQLRQ